MRSAGGVRGKPLFLAHRGDWTRAVENSLDAFAAAAHHPGIDGIEFDVRAAGDGTPVVIHDADLRRVQGDPRRVADLSATDLEQLGVPTLATVLQRLPRAFFLDIEFKEDVGAAVVSVLTGVRGDPPPNVVVSSFLPDALSSVRTLAPGWPSWLIHEHLDRDVIEQARSLGCRGIAAEWPSLTGPLIGLAREEGLELMTWTVPDLPVLRGILRLGLDAICLDPPALP